MKQYTYPIVIVLCSLILGGSILIAQINKQNSIERQAQLKLEAEQEENERKDAEYDICAYRAETAYWDYMEINGEKDEETGVITAANRFWDTARENKQTAIDNCFRKIYK